MSIARCLPYLAVTATFLAAGCGPDLGSCEPDAATALVYDTSGTPYYAGQYIVTQSCASGFCHSTEARRGQRLGAPAGLNFDVAPVSDSGDLNEETRRLRNAILEVRDQAESMWGQVDAGWMPPDGVGGRFAGPYPGCTDDEDLVALLGTDQALEALPQDERQACDGVGLSTVVFNVRNGDTRRVLRNWLACDGPLVERCEGTGTSPPFLGTEVSCDLSPVGPNFESIWMNVLSSDRCTACHSPDGLEEFFNDGGRLDFSSRSSAYSGLLMPPMNRQTECNLANNIPLVDPGNPDGSLLVQKLRGTQTCGDAMPIAAPPLSSAAIEAIEEWIRMGAENNDAPAE